MPSTDQDLTAHAWCYLSPEGETRPTVTPIGEDGAVSVWGETNERDASVACKATLDQLQERLHSHFAALRDARSDANSPVFALEHGLADGDLSVLRATIREWVRLRKPARRYWLPFVVHATEVGYQYDGDEYWPTLEADTPGWERHIGRSFVRSRFLEFADTFGGARPRGPWASHFTNICWPITHAILPTDLQRHFARLLYDYRGTLTSELLATPEDLGVALAGRVGGTSKRFQQLAQNTDLLGQVAASLLAGAPEDASILPQTLDRLVEDLGREREARRWLADARISADRVRRKGFAAGTGRSGGEGSGSVAQRPTSPVPFSVHPTADGWQLRLRVPDFTPLLSRHPGVADELAQVRCRVAGTPGRPQARGWLLFSGKQVALDRWPGRDTPIFELERADHNVASFLRDESRTPLGEAWVFRIGPDGAGRLVRSGAVLPGTRYLVIGPSIGQPAAEWATPASLDLDGAQGLVLDVPETVDQAVRDLLAGIGVGVQSAVELKAVGLVPAAWDGQGYGEWIIGTRPLLSLASTHEIEAATVSIGGAPSTLVRFAPSEKDPLLLQLPELPVGWHEIRLSFLVAEGAPSVGDGLFEAHVREPEVHRSGGTFRDPLRLMLTPPFGSLEDVWDGRAALELEGPNAVRTRVTADLRLPDGESGASHGFEVQLPVTLAEWGSVFASNVRSARQFQQSFDEAAALVIEAGDDELGRVSVTLEREVAPIRWGFTRRAGRLMVKLYESADLGIDPVVRFYPFRSADEASAITPADDRLYTDSSGGLFTATLDGIEIGAVVPPEVKDLKDLKPRVGLQERSRTTTDVEALIRTSASWTTARAPGDLVALMARDEVVDAHKGKLGELIGGKLWASLERRLAARGDVPLGEWGEALAKPGDWHTFRRGVRALSERRLEDPPIEAFAGLLGPGRSAPANSTRVIVSSSGHRPSGGGPATGFHIGGERLAEFLLRLASDPGTLNEWDGAELTRFVDETLKHPVVYRAARMVSVCAQAEGGLWRW